MDSPKRRVAILVEDQYQDQEVWYPYYRLLEAGHSVIVVGTNKKDFKSKHGYPIVANVTADKVSASDFDALIVPGGYAPDNLRRYGAVLKLVKEMNQQGKLIGAICHAGWVLCSADILRGRTMTGFFAIKDDLINAGAKYVDQDVVRDGNLITSRKPDDLPAFLRTIVAALAEPAAAGGAPRRRADTKPH
jgi:protease I